MNLPLTRWLRKETRVLRIELHFADGVVRLVVGRKEAGVLSLELHVAVRFVQLQQLRTAIHRHCLRL